MARRPHTEAQKAERAEQVEHLHAQIPNKIAGYSTWQKSFHRQVTRSEHGIRILAPVTRRLPKTKPDGTPTLDRPASTPSHHRRRAVTASFRIKALLLDAL